MKEIWKNIIGFEDYQISNKGRVKSLPKKYRVNEKIIKPMLGSKGYLRVTLWNSGKYKRFLISRLVAIYFIKKVKDKDIVNHKDSNPLNNNVSNLEWCTQSENMLHAFRTKSKLPIIGENCSWSKLKEYEVLEIRKSHELKELNMRELAEKYNINKTTVWEIIHRKIWKQL